MKVIYPVCCGIDVHKTFLVATIIKTASYTPEYFKKRFSTHNNDILKFKKWLIENNCYDVCMESTGKYWIPVFNLLEDTIRVTIANPKWVRAVKGNKDDKKDSKWIGDLFRLGLVPGSFIPPKDIRILRELTRYRSKLVSARSGEKNRFQNSFTVCNIALDSVVSDMFGKSATAISDYILTSDTFDPNHCVSLLKGKLKKKSDEVIESIEGYHMMQPQKDRALIIKKHIAFLDQTIAEVDAYLDDLVQPYEQLIQLLCSIPGVKRQSAIIIISEIGSDMTPFENSKKISSWAGLAPSSNESAGKKKSVKISRAGVYLKPALVQVAHAANKSKGTPYYKIKYDRISKRRGKKRAIIAIARMILTAIYHMINTGELWNPSDLIKIDTPEYILQRQKDKAIKEATKLLIKEGILKVS
jgi:transposase